MSTKASIGIKVAFLDLRIQNNHGILSTSVYHKLAAEPSVVPFNSDHPRHVLSNIIQAALLRAVRYSSTLEIFQKERRLIRLMLLYNGYPSRYIDTHFRKFFGNSISNISMIPFIYNENQFAIMRNSLFAQLSATYILNETTNDDYTRDKTATLTTISKQKKSNKFTNTFFLHYTHEKRLNSLKHGIHKIYSETFHATPAMDIRLIVGHRNHRHTGHGLLQRRPQPSLLKPLQLPITTKQNAKKRQHAY